MVQWPKDKPHIKIYHELKQYTKNIKLEPYVKIRKKKYIKVTRKFLNSRLKNFYNIRAMAI